MKLNEIIDENKALISLRGDTIDFTDQFEQIMRLSNLLNDDYKRIVGTSLYLMTEKAFLKKFANFEKEVNEFISDDRYSPLYDADIEKLIDQASEQLSKLKIIKNSLGI